MNNLIWKILLIIQPFIGNIFVSLFGGNINENNRDWYKKLNQSPLTPPNIVFPIVWSILYLFLGISALLVYIKCLKNPKTFKNIFLLKYLTTYEIQLLLNFLWSIFFFGLQKPKISLIIVFFMIALTAYLLYQSWDISKPAFWLLLPYGIWITFAMYLNFHIVVKNKV